MWSLSTWKPLCRLPFYNLRSLPSTLTAQKSLKVVVIIPTGRCMHFNMNQPTKTNYEGPKGRTIAFGVDKVFKNVWYYSNTKTWIILFVDSSVLTCQIIYYLWKFSLLNVDIFAYKSFLLDIFIFSHSAPSIGGCGRTCSPIPRLWKRRSNPWCSESFSSRYWPLFAG